MTVRFPITMEFVVPIGMMPMRAADLPNLATAVNRLAVAAQAQWQAYAAGAPLPDGTQIQSRTGQYLRSIQIREQGPFSAEVYSDLSYAHVIEEGAPARDLKRMLDTSLKVRMSKAGKRYLIIPFRWGTPGTKTFGRNVMPDAIHALAKDLEASRVKSAGWRLSGTGAWDVKTRAPAKVGARSYLWGGRLKADAVADAGEFGSRAKHFVGMVKFQHPHLEGGGKHTQYMTFRVMVEGSKGWLAPAVPGKHPARSVADQFRPLAKAAWSQALEADIRAFMGIQE